MYSVPNSARSAALQLSRSTHESHRTDVDHDVPLFPTCGRHVRCTQIGESSKDHVARKSPRGCPLDSLVPCQFCLVFGPGHSVFLFSFSFDFEKIFPEVHRQRFFLATAVCLLCDDYWTGCVDGRHIISSRAMSEDNQRCL